MTRPAVPSPEVAGKIKRLTPTAELLPCPFCGEQVEEETNWPGTFSHPWCDGECPAWEVDLRFPEQYAAWNRRTAPAGLTVREVYEETQRLGTEHWNKFKDQHTGAYDEGAADALDILERWIEERAHGVTRPRDSLSPRCSRPPRAI